MRREKRLKVNIASEYGRFVAESALGIRCNRFRREKCIALHSVHFDTVVSAEMWLEEATELCVVVISGPGVRRRAMIIRTGLAVGIRATDVEERAHTSTHAAVGRVALTVSSRKKTVTSQGRLVRAFDAVCSAV